MGDARLDFLNVLPDDAALPVHWVRKFLARELDADNHLASRETREGDLTVRQVADRYGRSPATVRRWLTSGRLEGWKLEREWRIPVSAIDNLRERNGSRQREPARVGISRNRDLGSWRQEYQEGGPSNGQPTYEKGTPPIERGSQ